MVNENNNCVVKVTYGLMHFLGTVTRHVRDGFFTIAPFMKPASAPIKNQTVTAPPPVIAQRTEIKQFENKISN